MKSMKHLSHMDKTSTAIKWTSWRKDLYEDHTTAILFIDAQLEKINTHASIIREEDWLEMIRILHAARVESANGKNLRLPSVTRRCVLTWQAHT